MDAVKQAGYGGSDARRERFARDGYLSPVRVPDAAAAAYRERMERAEAVTPRRKHPSP